MDMGFEDPLKIEALGRDEGHHSIGRAGVGPARGVVEVQHAVDHGAGTAFGFLHDIGEGVRRLVKEGMDGGVHGLPPVGHGQRWGLAKVYQVSNVIKHVAN